MRARCTPSTRTLTVPSGSLSICRILATVPTSYRSSGAGSSFAADFCATSTTFLPSSIAASSALIDFGRPTKSGITICGNTTTSRNGSSGRISASGEAVAREFMVCPDCSNSYKIRCRTENSTRQQGNQSFIGYCRITCGIWGSGSLLDTRNLGLVRINQQRLGASRDDALVDNDFLDIQH